MSVYTMDDREFVDALDDLPLWSAPFGLTLLESVAFRRGMNALDLCCGTGFPFLELAERLGPSCSVYGVDMWPAGLERVHRKIGARGIGNATPVQGRAEALPFPDAFFGLIVSNNGINNVGSIPAALAECARVSSPGAQLLLTLNLDGSLREFYEALRRSMSETGLADRLPGVDAHIRAKRPALDELTAQLERAGFSVRDVRQESFRMRFQNSEAFFGHHLIRMFFLPCWEELVPADGRQEVFERVRRDLDERAAAESGLAMAIPFALLDARRREK